MTNAIEARGVFKSFGDGNAKVDVLRGTDFNAKSGETTFLVGPSGCGKTTLISILGAILSSDDGEVVVLGQNLSTMRKGKLAQFRLANVGFIFQQFNLLPTLTAAENASLPLVARGTSNRKAEAAARALLESLGVGAHSEKMPSQLSGGQQQRVAIARALVHSPDVLICDEPTASLDAHSGQQVMELLRDIAAQGNRAVLVVTHDNRIFDFADTIHHMSDGRIVPSEQVSSTEATGI